MSADKDQRDAARNPRDFSKMPHVDSFALQPRLRRATEFVVTVPTHKADVRSRPRRRYGLIRTFAAHVSRELAAEQRLARLR